MTDISDDSKNSLFGDLIAYKVGRDPAGKSNKILVNPLSANPTKWPSTHKQFVCKLLTNCLNMFDHFVGLAPKGLRDKTNLKRKHPKS